MGVPSQHPFRETRLGSVLPSDRQLIAEALRLALQSSRVLEGAIKTLAAFLGIVGRCDRAQAEVLDRAARRALTAPNLRGVELRTGDWQAKGDQLRQLLEAGARHAEIRRQHDEIVIPEAWDQDLLRARQVLNTVGRKWWRWLSSDYRRIRRQVAGLCRSDPPKDSGSQLRIVDAVMEAARLSRVVQEYHPLGASLYGVQWQRLNSDWTVLKGLADWIVTLHRDVGEGKLPAGIIDFLAGNPSLDLLKGKVEALEAALVANTQSLSTVFERLDLGDAARRRIGAEEFPALAFELQAMLERLDALQECHHV